MRLIRVTDQHQIFVTTPFGPLIDFSEPFQPRCLWLPFLIAISSCGQILAPCILPLPIYTPSYRSLHDYPQRQRLGISIQRGVFKTSLDIRRHSSEFLAALPLPLFTPKPNSRLRTLTHAFCAIPSLSTIFASSVLFAALQIVSLHSAQYISYIALVPPPSTTRAAHPRRYPSSDPISPAPLPSRD